MLCECHTESGPHDLCCGHEDGRSPDCPIHGDGSGPHAVRQTVVEQLDAARDGKEFGQAIQGLFASLEKTRWRSDE